MDPEAKLPVGGYKLIEVMASVDFQMPPVVIERKLGIVIIPPVMIL